MKDLNIDEVVELLRKRIKTWESVAEEKTGSNKSRVVHDYIDEKFFLDKVRIDKYRPEGVLFIRAHEETNEVLKSAKTKLPKYWDVYKEVHGVNWDSYYKKIGKGVDSNIVSVLELIAFLKEHTYVNSEEWKTYHPTFAFGYVRDVFPEWVDGIFDYEEAFENYQNLWLRKFDNNRSLALYVIAYYYETLKSLGYNNLTAQERLAVATDFIVETFTRFYNGTLGEILYVQRFNDKNSSKGKHMRFSTPYEDRMDGVDAFIFSSTKKIPVSIKTGQRSLKIVEDDAIPEKWEMDEGVLIAVDFGKGVYNLSDKEDIVKLYNNMNVAVKKFKKEEEE